MSQLLNSSSLLDDLCQALPFLKQIPPDLRQNIDTSTLYEPKGAIAEMRAELVCEGGQTLIID